MPSYWDYIQDAMRALGSGVVTGTANIAGLPGELRAQVSKGFDQFDNAIGYQPKQIPPDQQPYYNIMPTGQQLDDFIRTNITGPAYQPQTGLGQGARMLGELAPSLAFSGGAANIGNRIMQSGLDPTRATILNALAGAQTGTQAKGTLSDLSIDAGSKRGREILRALALSGAY